MTILIHFCSNCGCQTRHYLVQPAHTLYEDEVYKCVECGKRSYINRNVSGSSNPIKIVYMPKEKEDATE